MVRKWAQRFYDNIDPPSNGRGFDGLGNLEEEPKNKAIIKSKRGKSAKEKERLGFRMDELEYMISGHAGITATFSLPYFYLAWNKNPQCPPDEWDDMSVTFVPTSKKTFKGLAVQRHSEVESTLDNINPIELSFSMNNDIDLGYGFWLIDNQYKDFVYAILKSSMFRAWCELTAYTKGQGHFTVGMWDTFPIQDTTTLLSKLSNRYVANMFKREGGAMTVEGAIACAGRWLSRNVWEKHSPTLNFDECMDELCGFGPASTSPYSRKQILAKGFLDVFPSLRNDVMSLA